MHGIWATVLSHADNQRVRCRPPKGKRHTPVIGDRVTFEADDDATEVGRIIGVETRAQTFVRPHPRRPQTVATHVDRLLLVSAVEPAPRRGLIDRVLVAMGDAPIDLLLVVNKLDLPGADAAMASLDCYEALGYTVLGVCATTGAGVDTVHAVVGEGLSVVVGQSGVGKSTLLNELVPGADLACGLVHEKTGKGKHTTTVSTCHLVGRPWPEGGLLADTPGIRSFSLAGFTVLDIAQRFPEFLRITDATGGCRFSNCLHMSEPDCVIQAALEEGTLTRRRYDDYRKLSEAHRVEIAETR
jgi:ribosome biogenesis GTPase